MAYEGQIAGVGDRRPAAACAAPRSRFMQRRSPPSWRPTGRIVAALGEFASWRSSTAAAPAAST